MRRLPLLLLLAAGCTQQGAAPEGQPIAVSVIGPPPGIADPSQRRLSGPTSVLLKAVAQGLVRLDAAGQIEPGLAIRWDVSDDGLYYTFRLDKDAALDAEDVARRLRSAMGPTSRNPLKTELSGIAEIVAVTDEVIEIRLRAPRRDLLQILAQPALALVGEGGGTGPFRISARQDGALRLVPTVPQGEANRGRDILLRGEAAATAVARFRLGQAGVVLGGRFTDLALARLADRSGRALRFDPATGLFGLAVVDVGGVLASTDMRRALAMAVDRERLVRSFAEGWLPQTALVPAGADDLPAGAEPDWAAVPLPARIANARAIVAAVRGRDADPIELRVALPPGHGARQLFALIAQDWRRIGIEAEAVAADASADLRLLDLVAPSAGAAWHLHRFSCAQSRACSAEADAALAAADEAPTLEARAERLAEADRLLARAQPFIVLATPLRWSLVAPNLTGYLDNPRAIHPLDQLRGDR